MYTAQRQDHNVWTHTLRYWQSASHIADPLKPKKKNIQHASSIRIYTIDLPRFSHRFAAFQPSICRVSTIDLPRFSHWFATFQPLICRVSTIDLPRFNHRFAAFQPSICRVSTIDFPSSRQPSGSTGSNHHLLACSSALDPAILRPLRQACILRGSILFLICLVYIIEGSISPSFFSTIISFKGARRRPLDPLAEGERAWASCWSCVLCVWPVESQVAVS